VENPRFLNPAIEKSDGLPLLPHAFDGVRELDPAQFSTDSNDQTRLQSVMFNFFLKQFDVGHIISENSVQCILFPLWDCPTFYRRDKPHHLLWESCLRNNA
jgi:hypothetical protein